MSANAHPHQAVHSSAPGIPIKNNQARRRAEEPVVTGPSVLCCVLLIGLILLGIALIAAGATIYTENDGYAGARMNALKDMLVQWGKVCEDVIKSLPEDLHIGIVHGDKVHKPVRPVRTTVEQEVPEVKESGKVPVSLWMAKAPIKRSSTENLTVRAFLSHDVDADIAVAESIPMRKTVTIDAMCKCRLVNCKCSGKDMCGSEMTFKGETEGCVNGKVCGTCTGNGFLKQVCLISSVCDKTNRPTQLSGCAYPFTHETHVYGPKAKDKIRVHLYDVNSPAIMRHAIIEGTDINGPSSAQDKSRSMGSILFGVGIPVLVLSLIGLITLCACKGWWCFYREHRTHGAWYEEESLNEHAIPMHGLESGADHIHAQKLKPMMPSSVMH